MYVQVHVHLVHDVYTVHVAPVHLQQSTCKLRCQCFISCYDLCFHLTCYMFLVESHAGH